MELIKIVVNNYRILKNLELDLEKNLSLVIGKNNCGKTSLLSILSKFIGVQSSTNNFNYDDFNTDFKKALFDAVNNDGVSWEIMQPRGIELYLYIQYDNSDNLANIRPLLLDLDPDNNIIILKFEYVLDKDSLVSLIEAFLKYYSRFKDDPDCKLNKSECFENFIKEKHCRYFKINKKTILYDTAHNKPLESEYRLFDATTIDLNKVICFKYIGARRDIENKDNDGTLSGLSGRYYEKTKTGDDDPTIQKFEDALLNTDASLNNIYQDLFENVIDKVKKFGGIKENETVVKIISTLSQQSLLKGNTTVVYEAENHQLPESYNGLGYLNLISIIFEIETLLSEFRNDKDISATPADINLLFIEEPEAHTHPQMQYIFIKNIKDLLNEGSSGINGKKKLDLQTIITTHSSHIVSECDFDDIKYFQRVSTTSVIAKNLKDLEIAYKDEKDPQNNHFKFLKQYLTLNYSEIFFADKVILYEGDTENILLPAMMKKIDSEINSNMTPLLSQNISLIPVGAYSQIFDKFLTFINIKTLIITDIDAGKQISKPDKNGISRTSIEACPVENGTHTTNTALKHYYSTPLHKYSGKELDFFKYMDQKSKILSNSEGMWNPDPTGKLMIVYQTTETDNGTPYYPRSFEDAFFCINREFIIDKSATFESLKHIKYFAEQSAKDTYKYDPYYLAQNCIQSKSSFALDVLLNSESIGSAHFTNWNMPSYIKEGLLWLMRN